MELLNFVPMKATQKKPLSTEKGLISIINSKRNGKRLQCSSELTNKLDLEDSVFIVSDGQSIVMSKYPLIENSSSYNLKDGDSGKKILYCAPLVVEISDILGLNFDDCVSRTLSDVEYGEDNEKGISYAVIKSETMEGEIDG